MAASRLPRDPRRPPNGIIDPLNPSRRPREPSPSYPFSGNINGIDASPASSARTTDEGKLLVSINLGTTFSELVYSSSHIAGGELQHILHWPGLGEASRIVPSCLLYDDHGQLLSWAFEAQYALPPPESFKCERFKLFLEPRVLRDENTDPRLPSLPPGKEPTDLIVDFLRSMWEYATEQINREFGEIIDLDLADVWLTVPATWGKKGCESLRNAAIAAGLVHQIGTADPDWQDRLHLITGSEAATVHCAHLTDLRKLKPSQTFMICGAEGSTLDLAVYQVLGQLAALEIAEVYAYLGTDFSTYLDLRFRELVRTLLADHPAHIEDSSLAYFSHMFSESVSINYRGEVDDGSMFDFKCFSVEDTHDPSVGLLHGDLSIPGFLLRREIFDPVVDQALEFIEEHIRKVDKRIDALILVGGCLRNSYFFSRVQERFGARVKTVARPSDADTAAARGAIQFGLTSRPLVSAKVALQAYIMKISLPAESEDFMKRPSYISMNFAGVPICENRLQYLVQKGAILRKGQMIYTKYRKYSQTPQDRKFVIIVCTSDSDRIMRYSDEGETAELCKWTVDIGSLSAFQENASRATQKGFHMDFEIGLELDGGEVYGILLYDRQECGRVLFDVLY